jgi:hypothetical protein
MKTSSKIKKIGLSIAAITFGLSIMAMSMASAQSSNTTNTTTISSGSGSSSSTTKQQQELSNIINRGNAEITRRLNSLNTLSLKITTTTKLSSSDQSYLKNEVNTEINGLNALKTELDNCASVAPLTSAVQCAITNAKNIINEYRVYALVLPKVRLIKMADDQLAIEANMTTLAQKIQSRITNDQTAGKNVSSLQTELNTVVADINAAQALSSSVEQAVLPLQPADYNTNHTVLSGYALQLQTARADLQTATNSAKTIINSLKSL